MKVRHLLSFVAFGAIVGYAAFYISSLGVRLGPPDDRVNVAMQVSDINGLVTDSNVLLRGVPVGKVTGVETSLSTATVHFYIDKRFQIPIDSEVRLENLSALGESYIGLRPRTADGPIFEDGQVLSTEQVTQPASISELASSAARMFNQMDPEQLARLVHQADAALPATPDVLPNLARASVLTRNMVRGLNGSGSEALANLQTLLQNAGFVGPILAQNAPYLFDMAKPMQEMYLVAKDFVYVAGAPESTRNAGKLFERFQGFLDSRAPDLKVVAEALMPYMQGISASLMNIDTGQILTNMLNAVPEDGTVTLRVATPTP